MATDGLPIEVACRVLGVSVSGYYEWLNRPPSARALRHAWLTERIAYVHRESRDTYGVRRVHAELTLGHGITVGREAVARLMRRAGLQGISGRPRYRRVPNVATAADRVQRQSSVTIAIRNGPPKNPGHTTSSETQGAVPYSQMSDSARGCAPAPSPDRPHTPPLKATRPTGAISFPVPTPPGAAGPEDPLALKPAFLAGLWRVRNPI